jgi:hypothetical protein
LPFELASGNKGDKEIDLNINLECHQTFIIHLYAVVNFIKDLFDNLLGFCEHSLQLSISCWPKPPLNIGIQDINERPSQYQHLKREKKRNQDTYITQYQLGTITTHNKSMDTRTWQCCKVSPLSHHSPHSFIQSTNFTFLQCGHKGNWVQLPGCGGYVSLFLKEVQCEHPRCKKCDKLSWPSVAKDLQKVDEEGKKEKKNKGFMARLLRSG